jgi:hypothetical protein
MTVRRNVKKKHRRPVKGDDIVVDTKPRTIKRKRRKQSPRARKRASTSRSAPAKSQRTKRST